MTVPAFDPFAAAPAVQDIPQVAPQAAAPSVWDAPPPQAPAPVVVAPVAAAPAGFKAPTDDLERVRITLKSGSAYDVPWITADFASLDHAHAQLTDNARKGRLLELFNVTALANSLFVKAVQGQQPAPAAAHVPQAGAAPAASQLPPGGQARSCVHGPMTFKSGAKNGRTWEAYFCPTPQNTPNQCKPQFLN